MYRYSVISANRSYEISTTKCRTWKENYLILKRITQNVYEIVDTPVEIFFYVTETLKVFIYYVLKITSLKWLLFWSMHWDRWVLKFSLLWKKAHFDYSGSANKKNMQYRSDMNFNSPSIKNDWLIRMIIQNRHHWTRVFLKKRLDNYSIFFFYVYMIEISFIFTKFEETDGGGCLISARWCHGPHGWTSMNFLWEHFLDLAQLFFFMELSETLSLHQSSKDSGSIEELFLSCNQWYTWQYARKCGEKLKISTILIHWPVWRAP